MAPPRVSVWVGLFCYLTLSLSLSLYPFPPLRHYHTCLFCVTPRMLIRQCRKAHNYTNTVCVWVPVWALNPFQKQHPVPSPPRPQGYVRHCKIFQEKESVNTIHYLPLFHFLYAKPLSHTYACAVSQSAASPRSVLYVKYGIERYAQLIFRLKQQINICIFSQPVVDFATQQS